MRFRSNCLVACCAVLSLFQILHAVTDTGYVGLNSNTGSGRSAAYIQTNISHLNNLGVRITRGGANNVGGYKKGDAFNFAERDGLLQPYFNAGIAIHMVLGPRDMVSRGNSYQEWKDNFDYFVKGVMNHHRGKIKYYIIDNEPDLTYLGTITEAQSVDMLKIAFQAAKNIDTAIMIESPPVNSPNSGYLRKMMELGMLDYCDFLGIHVYSAGILDDCYGKPWECMGERGVRKPVAVSECGTTPNWAPAGINGEQWRRRFLPQLYLASKRMGISHIILFSLAGDESGWNFADDRTTPWTLYQPGYDGIKNGFRNDAFANGGFEAPENGEDGWQLIYHQDLAVPPSYAKFVANSPANARNGSGHLLMETGTTSDAIKVRRLAEKLIPGQNYQVEAYAFVTGGGRARLKLLGFDHLDGDREIYASSTSMGRWERLSVEVAPSKTWIVIELQGDGTRVSGQSIRWDDVTITAIPKNTSAFNKIEAENYDRMLGIVTEDCFEGGQDVAWVNTGDYIQFNSIIFGNGATVCDFRVSCPHNNRKIELRLDSPTGSLIGTLPIRSTGGFQNWQTQSCDVSGVSGTRNVFLVFSDSDINLNWFQFRSNPGSGISSGLIYRITAKHSGKSLEVLNSRTDDSAAIVQRTYSGGNHQQWKVESTGDGFFKITAQHSGKALEVLRSETGDGATIRQAAYTGSENQRWNIESVGDGYYKITNKATGKGLDVSMLSVQDGAPILQWPYSNGDHQKWLFSDANSTSSLIGIPALTQTIPAVSEEYFGLDGRRIGYGSRKGTVIAPGVYIMKLNNRLRVATIPTTQVR